MRSVRLASVSMESRRLPCSMENFSGSSSEPLERTVVCMKWGRKYSAEYVNVLARMGRRNCSVSYRFFCITDDVAGLDSDIHTLPIPACPLPRRPDTEAWRKILLFDSSIGLSGTCLFLDLDVVVTRDVGMFFKCEGPFWIIRNWTHPDRRVGNSSVMRFVAGAHTNVFRTFIRDPDRIATLYPNEQSFLSHEIDVAVGLSWWPDAWCRSYKKHCLSRLPKKLFAVPVLPDDCRILVFHGTPNPPDAARKWFYKTNKPFRLPKIARPAPWILSHWK